MASNDIDDFDGHPIFLAGYAPDLGVDETTAAEYAADVGNRIIRANLAELDDYEWNRAGLWGHALDTKSDYRHDGTGWKIVARPWTNYTPTIANFTGTFSTAKYMIYQGVVTVKFRIAVATMSTAPTISLPLNASDALEELLMSKVLFLPSTGSRGIGHIRKDSATVASLVTEATLAGTVYVSGVTSTSPITFGATSTIAATFQYEAA
ncbi:hypothetical protein [Microbacterium sp. LWH11-1.2]|uniref:hypothetical protein n=1 Tax=Microbacterium sp. LWH11-1.2 TaxID=3135258 RepID=UPI003139B9AB